MGAPKTVTVGGHPNKRTQVRLADMLALDVPLWKIAEVLKVAERSIHRYYPKTMADAERKAGGATRGYEASPSDKMRVKLLASAGNTHVTIARFLGISKPTLEKHFREELDNAEAEISLMVMTNLVSLANGPPDGKHKYNALALIAARRLRWVETSRQELSGPDGAPIQTEHQAVIILPDNHRGETIEGGVDHSAEDDVIEEWPAIEGPSQNDSKTDDE